VHNLAPSHSYFMMYKSAGVARFSAGILTYTFFYVNPTSKRIPYHGPSTSLDLLHAMFAHIDDNTGLNRLGIQLIMH
jgi:hypothetical protein